MSDWEQEILDGKRFEFGANWSAFLDTVDESRIEQSRRGLRASLGLDSLEGLTFLDVGCGSGLHSLAARSMGAKVHSFDYDPKSVACAEELRRRYFPDDPDWKIERGSALDADYLEGLGAHDIVYSWGVLHHTGDMWRALELVERNVAEGGRLFLALYNDQGMPSRVWTQVKRAYVASPKPLKLAITLMSGAYFESRGVAARVLRRENPLPFEKWAQKKQDRGMTVWYDLVDWVGGYPFEVSKPDAIFEHFKAKGYRLEHLRTCQGGLGCNEYVFIRTPR
ncbi:MAG: class I SAM-dependent methyltransferase [Myxococcales bacterium]|nr:class I SAM-dependent methyltransferase [Myxococcales bacterium]